MSPDDVQATGVTIPEILAELDYTSRDLTRRDAEGNLWCFGTYWPKAE